MPDTTKESIWVGVRFGRVVTGAPANQK